MNADAFCPKTKKITKRNRSKNNFFNSIVIMNNHNSYDE